MITSTLKINSTVYDNYDEAVDRFIALENGDDVEKLKTIQPNCAIVSGNYLLFCNEISDIYIIVHIDIDPMALKADTPEYEILIAVQRSLVAFAEKIVDEKPTKEEQDA